VVGYKVWRNFREFIFSVVGEQPLGASCSSEIHRRFIAICSPAPSTQTKKEVVHTSLAMKVLLEALFAALVLIIALASMLALAYYHTQTTIERSPQASESFAVVASEDGESYRLVEWEASCEVWALQSESDIVEVNFSESEPQECRVQMRPFLANTRHPGVRATDGHRAEPSSENLSSTHSGE
jgi:hypothetical protein